MQEFIEKIVVVTLVFGLLWLAAGCTITETKTDDNPVAEAILNLLPPSPSEKRIIMVEKISSDDADIRREGVKMLGEGPAPNWTVTRELLALMAQNDPEPQVRVTALDVFAKIDSAEEFADLYRLAAQDQSPLVRMACVRALSQRNDNDTLNLLVDILKNDPEGMIRTEATVLIGNYPTRKSIDTLIQALADDEEFGVRYRSKESLNRITGQDFEYNHQAWRQWYNSTDNPFVGKG
ncbi:MAG: hypothetical protein GY869_02580 [Planctomycetes bacterium]|nr:hypothetical protein [Planctomycetota bacterium]